MKDKGITVLVCTYNGAARLPVTLKHLARQSLDTGLNWEVIVIDNLSTDNSAAVASNEWAKYNLQHVGFKVITEERPGKINALDKGTRFAAFDCFIICDDDNWLLPGYLQQMYILLTTHPLIGAVGGQSIAVNDSGIYPSWFDDFTESYAIGKQGNLAADVTLARGYLWGAGLGTRTSLYRSLYKDFPSLLTGRNGEKLSAGEDSEYCQRLILSGHKLYYDPELVFCHYIPEKRLEISYRDALLAGFTECEGVLNKYYLAVRIKTAFDKGKTNKFWFLFSAFFSALFTLSKKNRLYRINMIKYILGRKYDQDPILESIRSFEKRINRL